MTVYGSRYTLDREIGRGGMGTVYLGTDVRTEEAIAIKKLRGDRHEPDMIARFQREAEALRALNHPNIVKAIGHFEEDGSHYIVMEYVDGRNLSEILVSAGQLPVRRAIEIALGVADALTRAHHLRITHRDVKPANVLIDREGTARLTDFGIAYWESKGKITEHDLQIGTPAYMSPEMLTGGDRDPRGDIWALGVLLFEMLTAKHPFSGSAVNTMLVNVLMTPTPDVQLMQPDCPEALADLIYRMLEKDPSSRISTARLVGAELEIIGRALDSQPVHDENASASRFRITPTPTENFHHNLPAQSAPLVGRETELDTVRTLLESPDTRLLTLTGAGGMGKTRLALGVAQAILADNVTGSAPDRFAHGLFFVPLAPLLSPEPMVAAIANALDFQFDARGEPRQQLLDYLREKHLLLITDNFEHVLDGAPLIAEILQAAPHVRILATSRERLNLLAETLYPLDGLKTPDESAKPDDLKASAAVRLFVQSARRALPTWLASGEEYAIIADICRRVSGLPLGIVLAAGWVQILSVAEIRRELMRGIDILESETRDIPERHRSMRGVFDYSWQLLTPEAQALLLRLSVFRGGFSRRAAQAVTGAGLMPLAALVSKSLLRRDPDTGSYHIHELLHQYIVGKRATLPDFPRIQAAHSIYYLNTLVGMSHAMHSPAQAETLRDIDGDIENLRDAWHFAAANGDLDKLELALPTLSRYFELRGQYGEGMALYQQTLQTLRGQPPSPARNTTIAYLLAHTAVLATAVHDFAVVDATLSEATTRLKAGLPNPTIEAWLEFARGYDHLMLKRVSDGRPHFERAAALFRAAQARVELARTLAEWSSSYWYRAESGSSDFDRARALAAETLAIQQSLGDTAGMASTLMHLGTIESYAGNDDEDARYTAESLTMFERAGSRAGMAQALNNIGVREMMLGNYTTARAHLERALGLKRQIGTAVPIAWSEYVLARLCYNEGRFEEGLRRADDGLIFVADSTHREWELTLQLSRGQALIALGRYAEAVAALDRTLTIAEETGSVEDQAFTLNRKAVALRFTGQIEASHACLNLALEKAQATGDVTIAAVSRLLMAWELVIKGDIDAARPINAEVTAYFGNRDNWDISYSNDEWALATWAMESALLTTLIAFQSDQPDTHARLLAAFDIVSPALAPSHICKGLLLAAHVLQIKQPALSMRLAQTITADTRAFANDRTRATLYLGDESPFASLDDAVDALRRALA